MLAGERRGVELVGDALHLAEHIADLAAADADIPGGAVGKLADVTVKLGDERLAEAHDLVLAFAVGIKVRAALAAADGQRREAVLEIHLKAEELHDREVDGGVEAQTALVGADGGVVLHAVAAVDLHLSGIVHPCDAERDDPVGLDEALKNGVLLPLGVLIHDALKALEKFPDALVELRGVGVAGEHLIVYPLEVGVFEHGYVLPFGFLLLAAECDELLGGGNAVRLIFLVEPRGLGREEGMRRVALVLLEIFRHGGDALAQLGDDLGIVDEIAERLLHGQPRVAREPEDLALRVGRVMVNAVDGVHRAVDIVEDPVREARLGLAVVVHLAENNESAGLHDALHLREQRREIGDVVQGVADADDIEGVILKIHMARIADNKVHRHTGALLSPLFKHLVGAVERDDLLAAAEPGVHFLGERAVARGDVKSLLNVERRKLLPQFIHEGSLLLLLLHI